MASPAKGTTTMTRQAISTDRAPAALGPYSQAVVANGWVFCSGMAGIDPATGAAPEGIEAQTEQALINLAAVLELCGKALDACFKPGDLVAITLVGEISRIHREILPCRASIARPRGSSHGGGSVKNLDLRRSFGSAERHLDTSFGEAF